MMHNGMSYDQGQGQGHRGLKLTKWRISKSLLHIGAGETLKSTIFACNKTHDVNW